MEIKYLRDSTIISKIILQISEIIYFTEHTIIDLFQYKFEEISDNSPAKH